MGIDLWMSRWANGLARLLESFCLKKQSGRKLSKLDN